MIPPFDMTHFKADAKKLSFLVKDYIDMVNMNMIIENNRDLFKSLVKGKKVLNEELMK